MFMRTSFQEPSPKQVCKTFFRQLFDTSWVESHLTGCVSTSDAEKGRGFLQNTSLAASPRPRGPCASCSASAMTSLAPTRRCLRLPGTCAPFLKPRADDRDYQLQAFQAKDLMAMHTRSVSTLQPSRNCQKRTFRRRRSQGRSDVSAFSRGWAAPARCGPP